MPGARQREPKAGAALNEAQLSAWCRERDLYPEQVRAWRRACEQVNDWDWQQAERLKAERKADREWLKALEHELKKKARGKSPGRDRSLAGVVKKAEAIWGEGEDA